MSNVISIGLPRRPNLSQRQSALLDCFARHRRAPSDVFWLKENAEALNVLASTGATLTPQGLDAYRVFYDGIEERMQFFPQYYRFLLSMCLDLEDLGLEGNKGEALCEWARRARLVEAELSDLQRAEAARLVSRRGDDVQDAGLTERLTRFICHAETFALPNKKAAYELTHIIFYLSDYGVRTLELPVRAITSLEYAGLLAFLDQDVDLLSEVCVALRFAGQTPSDIWEDWLEQELAGFILAPTRGAPAADAYHEYLVSSWWGIHAGRAAFPGVPQSGTVEIRRHKTERGPLRAMSELMYNLGATRSGDWNQMRELIEQALPPEHHSILNGAAQSSQSFETFFEGFARA